MIYAVLRLSLLLFGWLGCYRLGRELSARGWMDRDWRMSFLLGSAAWGALVAFITELSSLGHWLNRSSLVSSWLLVDVALWTGCLWLARTRTAPAVETLPKRISLTALAAWPLDIRLMWTWTALLVVFLGIVALLTPTTNWDSFTYHLPRVMHWIQQQGVQHYPTGSIGQLQMGPWAAFVQTHLFLLRGDDLFANLVQWCAMLGCIVLATLIAKQLSPADEVLSRRAQALAALLVVTLPTGIVESITPQTDYVAAFWFSGLMSALLALRKEPANLCHFSGVSLAGGLGLLTKITFVLYVAPVGLAAGLWLIRRWRSPFRIAGRTLLFSVIVGALLLPHARRNHGVFGSSVSSRSTQENGQNTRFSLSATLSNMIRNAALHTNTGIRPLTRLANETLGALHLLTGRDLDDPETTLRPARFEFQEKFVIYDSETGNPYHFALGLIALALLLRRSCANRWLGIYALALAASYALFCATLKWQPWNTRYHLPYFVLLMPLVAVMAARWPKWSAAATATGLFVFAAVVIVANQSRPVFNPAYVAQPRFRKMLFEQGPLFAEQLETMVRDVVNFGCAGVGLKLDSDDAEYPLWVAFRNQGFTGRLDHVLVENETARIAAPARESCLLITMTTNVPPADRQPEFPYQMKYGLMSVWWSESASRWSELIQFDFATQSSRPLSRVEAEIPFDRRVAHVFMRTPRAGLLKVSGKIVDGNGTGIDRNTLRIATDAGHTRELALDGQAIATEIPAPAGTTRIRLSLLEPVIQAPAAPRLTNVRWTFAPDERK